MTTKMATAFAEGQDSREVAAKAAQTALERLHGDKPVLAVVYSSIAYDPEQVASQISETLGGPVVVGTTSAGEFTEERVGTGGIVVGVLASDSIKPFVGTGSGLRRDVEKATQEATSQLPTVIEGFPHRCALVFFDGLAGVGEEVAALVSTALGTDIPIAGGAAADDFKMSKTYVFCNNKAIHDAVSVCLLASKTPLQADVRHGHHPITDAMTITKAKGNVLYEIDGRPAWDVWKERTRGAASALGIDVERLNTSTEIGKFFANYELGLTTGKDSYKVRWPSGVNEDGSINFTCAIAEGSVFRIMDGSKLDDLIEAAGKATRLAIDRAVQNGGGECAGAFVFECAVRAVMLQERFDEEVETIKGGLGALPLVGAELYGELCMNPGSFSGYHNTTTVALVVPAD